MQKIYLAQYVLIGLSALSISLSGMDKNTDKSFIETSKKAKNPKKTFNCEDENSSSERQNRAIQAYLARCEAQNNAREVLEAQQQERLITEDINKTAKGHLEEMHKSHSSTCTMF